MAEVAETGFQSLDGIFWGLGLHPHDPDLSSAIGVECEHNPPLASTTR